MVEPQKNTSIKKSLRREAFVQLAILLGILLALNIISGIYYKRIDLTEDKRFTVSDQTKHLVNNLGDILFVKVYLAGDDLPPGFRKLGDATKDMLDEFRYIAGEKVQYQFIDPNDVPDAQSRKNLYQQLASQGLQPMSLQVSENDELKQKIIFPGAIVTYQGRDIPVDLVGKQVNNQSSEQILHNSTTELEFQLADAMRKVLTKNKKKIAFIQGHGELRPLQLADAEQTLSDYYEVDFVNLPMYKVGRLDDYAAIIIAKPDSFFTDLEKYKIDQFLMRGGKVLWFVETLNANMDSLDRNGVGLTTDYNLNLVEDFLFKYGVRINYNQVLDLSCHFIPLLSSKYGSQQQRNFLPWPFYPLVTPNINHPIVNNLNPIWFQFANSIDTVYSRQNPGVKKTILLQSSPYTRTPMNPVRINLQMAYNLERERPLYQQGPQNLAVLLEGEFVSPFAGRLAPQVLASGDYGDFKEKSTPTKMIVVSDGDVIRSHVTAKNDFYPMGFDHYMKQMFGNKNFVLNSVDFLLDEGGLITLRSKEFRMRLLDTTRIKSEKVSWQLFNIALPIGLLLVFGLVFNYIRKRRFAS